VIGQLESRDYSGQVRYMATGCVALFVRRLRGEELVRRRELTLDMSARISSNTLCDALLPIHCRPAGVWKK